MNTIGIVQSVPRTLGAPSPQSFIETTPVFEERNFTITGVTKDSSGNPLGSCTVRLFNSATNVLAQTVTSDGSGNYSFIVDKTQAWYVVAYKAGAPDTAGTTVNTVVGL